MLFLYPPIILIYLVPVVLISLTFHEFSHAYTSYRLGDPTAKYAGRLTLNPLKHLDILGTLMFLFSRFGWAKPVPINPMYYKDRNKGTMIVSVAGPLSNILLALIFSFPMIYLERKYGIVNGSFFTSFNPIAILYNFSFMFYMINIGLAAFNILPVPPLDGSNILQGILPPKYNYKMHQYQSYISIGFMMLILIAPRALNTLLSPFIWFFQTAINMITNSVIGLFH
ncbi:MAG TPA: site-2 protease family protein [Clostridiaceae bacterium]|nr:site-2 protease family protein [Clostridiaceae bacterium]